MAIALKKRRKKYPSIDSPNLLHICNDPEAIFSRPAHINARKSSVLMIDSIRYANYPGYFIPDYGLDNSADNIRNGKEHLLSNKIIII